MSWRNIKLIFQREFRDQMRDRRTLFMIAILPLLLYPALGIGMVQMLVLFQEQPRTVVVLGENELPKQPPLLKAAAEGDGPRRFVESWFQIRSDAAKLDVFSDASVSGEDGEEVDPGIRQLIDDARQIRDKFREREALRSAPPDAETQTENRDRSAVPAATASHAAALAKANEELGSLFATSQIQVLIIVPEGFGRHIAAVNRQLRERAGEDSSVTDYERPIIVHNKANKKSQIAYTRVLESVTSWEKSILRDRLRMAQLPQTLHTPVNAESVDLARAEDMSDSFWSVLFPALLITMSLTGAFYPAIDLGAGEKERGTMETLLICPASRTEIVMGKFLTVLLFSMSTAILNLASMGLTGRYMLSLGGGGTLSNLGNLSPPSIQALMWVLVLLIPLAALFSALCLSLATFARSSKEGQYYLTPLLMVTMGLTIFCLSPAVEIEPFYSILPIVGPALLLKELLSSPQSAEPLVYAIPVLVTSVGYSLLALWWAIEQFAREEVLFREAERFELGLWIRHLLRDKEPTPSFAEGGFCFILIMLIQFAALKPFQVEILQAESAARVLQFQVIFLIVTIACPALFMSVMLTTNVFDTLRLRWPRWQMFAVAAVLPIVLHPLSVELLGRLEWFFPQLPEGSGRLFQSISDASLPLWFVLAAFAITPAICEELAFRGFILSGFCRSKRKWLPIVLSSIAFGIVHMIPQQVFNAALLGLVLGLIAVCSGSLFPAILFHFVYNSLQVLRGRIGSGWVHNSPAEWFFSPDAELIRYRWPTLLIAAIIAIVLLRWLVNQRLGVSGTIIAKVQIAAAEPGPLRETAAVENTSVQI